MIDSIYHLPWQGIHEELDGHGYAHIKGLLSPDTCHALAGLYDTPSHYRTTISMERYRFGKGEYKYFNYPLPPLIHDMREAFYKHLAPLANDWMHRLNRPIAYPATLSALLDQCHAAGQSRPTPLILRYEKGGYNTLHQDLYGDVYFPFQVVLALSQPERDYTGGELVFVEQLPRAQSKATVVLPSQGDVIVFTTHFRPVKGARGYYQAKMKHGVSTLTSGRRYAMGLIFHDAK